MNEKIPASQRGQSLVLVAAAMVVLVAAAMVVLVGFVAFAVDLSSAYYARRTAQNAADGAALAGVSEMATGLNKHNVPKLDAQVKAAMDEFAELNGIEYVAYINAIGTEVNGNVEGYYVDGSGNRLPGPEVVGEQSSKDVPKDAMGVEAITHITATSFFGGIFGVRGYPIQARAVSLVRQACSSNCVVPIVTSKETLFGPSGTKPYTNRCFNIWTESYDGLPEEYEGDPDDYPSHAGSYGWVSWSWQQLACEVRTRPCPPEQQGTGCSDTTLATNLNPDNCGTGYVETGDYVANTTGIMNSNDNTLCYLDYYMGIPHENINDCGWSSDVPIPFTIVVYDDTNLDNPNDTAAACGGITNPSADDLDNPDAWGLLYHVGGFAQMQILGYQLSQGGTNVSALITDTVYLSSLDWSDPLKEDPDPDDPYYEYYIDLRDGFDPMVDCLNPPGGPGDGNRITAYFMNWVTSYSSSNACYDPWGTLLASPRLIE